MAATEPKDFPFFAIFNKKTKTVKTVFSCFYNNYLITNIDKFPRAVALFKKIVTHFDNIDLSIYQSIINMIRPDVAIAIVTIHVKHEGKMFSLYEMIKKSLLLQDFFSTTPLPNLDATLKVHFSLIPCCKNQPIHEIRWS